MNALNRIVLLIVALLMIAVPVLFLLINFGVLPAEVVNRYTAYQAGLQSLESVTTISLTSTPVRIIVGVAGALIALIALLLVLRELTFGRVVSRSTIIDDSPGSETKLTYRAVRSLAEGAAREVGASRPSASLTHGGNRPYIVECNINVPEPGNYTEVAARARENIRRVLEGQSVAVKDVYVTVQGNASQSA